MLARMPSIGRIFTSLQNLIIVLLTVLFFSCDQNKKIESPPGYDLSSAYRYTLPSILNEISGLAYYPKDSSVFAIQDEKGFLFKIHFTNPLKIDRWKFGNGADYEDVILHDSDFYVLKSKGSIEKLKFNKDSISVEPFSIPAQGRGEFETLYYDNEKQRVIVTCKNCEQDKKNQLTSFGFNPATNSFDTSFTINTEQIWQLAHDDKERIKPSAAAFHPITGELFLLASVNKLLIVFNKDRSPKAVYHLDPDIFKQPEGLTFTPKGDMLISNESANSGSADILIFKYNQSKERK